MIAYADRLTRCGRDGGLEAAPLRDFGHPAFPAPFDGRKILAKLGRIAPRDSIFRSGCSKIESVAISLAWPRRHMAVVARRAAGCRHKRAAERGSAALV
jgi:hypothetical protein